MSEFAAAGDSGDDEKEPMPTMGFLDHLEELRKRACVLHYCGGRWIRRVLVEGGVALRLHAEADRRRASQARAAGQAGLSESHRSLQPLLEDCGAWPAYS